MIYVILVFCLLKDVIATVRAQADRCFYLCMGAFIISTKSFLQPNQAPPKPKQVVQTPENSIPILLI